MSKENKSRCLNLDMSENLNFNEDQGHENEYRDRIESRTELPELFLDMKQDP